MKIRFSIKFVLILCLLCAIITNIVLFLTNDRYIRMAQRIYSKACFAFSKKYESAYEAMDVYEEYVGNVGNVSLVCYDDMIPMLIIPSGKGWKKIALHQVGQAFKTVAVVENSYWIQIIKINGEWYAFLELRHYDSFGPNEKVAVYRNSDVVVPEQIWWKDPNCEGYYYGVILLGLGNDVISFDFDNTHFVYEGKWKLSKMN